VAANVLAEHGWDVVVLEGAPVAGGAVQSAEVTAPGFLTDLFSAFYPMTVASPVIRDLALEDHGLRWAHAPKVLASPKLKSSEERIGALAILLRSRLWRFADGLLLMTGR